MYGVFSLHLKRDNVCRKKRDIHFCSFKNLKEEKEEKVNIFLWSF